MNPHRKYKNHGPHGITLVFMFLVLLFIPFVVVVLNPIHKKNIEKLSQPPLIKCHQCKGSGEYPTDVNKLMVEASITLFINKHLMVDKCKECVKLEKGNGYVYCKVVNDRYRTLLEEYIAAGRKIEMADCSECMGMGTFTSQNSDGSYVTQEEYDSKHHK
jgi:hypothetical protein